MQAQVNVQPAKHHAASDKITLNRPNHKLIKPFLHHKGNIGHWQKAIHFFSVLEGGEGGHGAETMIAQL